MEHEWGKECYVERCTRKERMGMIWWRAGIWKLRRIRKGFERGRCPLCLGEEGAKHIILECCETKKWREKYVHSNWLNMNEDLTYKKITCCNNAKRLKAIGKYLFKSKFKWESKVKGAYNMTVIGFAERE
jgi:hypothetical protein